MADAVEKFNRDMTELGSIMSPATPTEQTLSFGSNAPSVFAPQPAPEPVLAVPSISDVKANTISNTDAKRQSVASKAEEKKVLLNGARSVEDHKRMIIEQENGLRGNEEIVNNGDPNIIADLANRHRARQEIDRIREVDRSAAQIIGDSTLAAISGLGSTVEGISELARIVTPEPLTGLNDALSAIGGAVSDKADSYKSDGIDDSKALSALEKEVRSEASNTKYDADIASGKSQLSAGLAKVGRDIASGAKAMVDNPATITDMIAESAPSLLVSAGVGSVAARTVVSRNLAARGASKETVERFLASDRGAQLLRETSIKLQPLLSGIQEAGGAAADAGKAVVAMTHDQLMTNSPEYQELVKTMSPDEAKNTIKNNVVKEAAFIQGLSGFATGHLTKTFDAAPLATMGIANTAKNLAGETVEEGIQGATGALAQNVAVQRHADENQRLLDNVGEGIAEGAVAGLGMAGAVQTPALAAKAVQGTAEKASDVAQTVKGAITARVENQVNEDSPVTDEAFNATQNEATNVADTITNTDNALADVVKSNYRVSDEEFNSLDTKLKELVGDENGDIPRDRTAFVNTIAKKAFDPSITEEDQLYLASQLDMELGSLSQMFSDDTESQISSLAEDDETKLQFQDLQSFTNTLMNAPVIQKLFNKLSEHEVASTNITEENANTDASAKEASVIAATAAVAPTNVDPEAGQKVLDLARKRIIQLPKEHVEALEQSVNISKYARLYSDAVAEIDGAGGREGYTSSSVSKQIFESGWLGDRGDRKLSLPDHAVAVRSLVQQGRSSEAAQQMKDLTGFVTTLNNKIDALNKSSKTGKKQSYMAYDPNLDGGTYVDTTNRTDLMMYGNPNLQLHKNNKGSIALYNRLFAETSAAVAVQRTMAEAYPDLGIIPMEMPKYSPSIAQHQSRLLKALSEAPVTKAPIVEAAPVVVEEAPTAVAEPVEEAPKRNIGELYGDKVGALFTARPTRSLIADAPSPAAKVTELMGNIDTDGKELINRKFFKAIPDVVSKITDNVNNYINNRVAKIGGDRTAALDKVSTYKEAKPMIFMKDNGKTVDIDPRVSETATISVMSELIGNRPTVPDAVEDLLEKLGISDTNKGDKALLNILQNYVPVNTLVENASKSLMRNLGMSPKGDVMESDSLGAVQSMALEIIHSMTELGMLEIASYKTADNSTFQGVKFNENFIDKEQSRELLRNSDLINSLIDPEGEKTFQVGVPMDPKLLSRKQKGTGLPLTAVQNRAVENSSKIGFTPNMPFLNVIDKINEQNPNAYRDIRGYVEITDEMRKAYTKGYLATIEGKNQSIEMEINDTMDALDRISEYAGQNDTDFADTPIFFGAEVTRVGRIQAVGPANGQANKFARAALRSTWSTLDMSNPAHQEGFWRTIVQMSGVKINDKKLEYLTTDELMANAEEAVNKKFGEVITELEKVLADKKANMDVIAKALKGQDPVVLETLVSVARLNMADEAERKAFRHSVPLEADGVTNGPAAVIMKFASDAFSPAEIKQWQRVGFFVGSDQKALHDKTADKDTYGITAEKAEKLISARRENIAKTGDKAIIDNFNATEAFLAKFSSKGLSIEDGVWALTRDATKNPLTKITYGAGQRGTASGLAQEAMSKFEEAFSKYMLENPKGTPKGFAENIGYPNVWNDLRTITGVKGTSPIIVKSDGKIATASNVGEPSMNGREGFELNKDAFNNLTSNINAVYVGPMYDAITQTMGSSFKNMQTFIKVAQIQSAVLSKMFEKFLSNYGPNEVPSPQDRKAFLENMKRLGALIETNEQAFSIGGNETGIYSYTNKDGKEVQKSVASSVTRDNAKSNKSLQISFRGMQPALAGVSAGAYINIGTGDGLMMTLAMGNPIEGMDKTLQIFDGMEMPADLIQSIGTHMNKAAYDAWQANTGQDVLNSFENFTRNLSKNLEKEMGLTQDDIKAIIADIEPYGKDDLTLNGLISTNLNDLRNAVDMMNARAKTRADFATWTDQMAGGNTPYGNKGIKLPANASDEEIANAMNERLNYHLGVEKRKRARITENNALLSNFMADNSTEVAPGVREVNLSSLLGQEKLMSALSAKLYHDVLKNGTPEGLQVLYGDAASLQAYRDSTLTVPTGTKPMSDVEGQYIPAHKALLIVSEGQNVGETIIHEMTHAAIADKIVDYFNNGARSKEHGEAVERLIGLTDEFLKLNFSKDNARVQDEIIALRKLHQDKGGIDAEVVNEVVATILTNPDVIAVARQQHIKNPIYRIAVNVFKALKALFPNMRNPGSTFYSNAAFNAQILTNIDLTTDPKGPSEGSKVLNKTKPTNSRAASVISNISNSVSRALSARGLGNAEFTQQISDTANDASLLVYQEMLDAGFEMNIEEGNTFLSVTNLFMSGAALNGIALVRAQEIYENVMKDLSVEDFMANESLNDPSDRQQAQDKFNAIISKNSKNTKDFDGNSLALAKFLALAVSNEEFGNILDTKLAPQAEKIMWDGVDNFLTDITTSSLDKLVTALNGEMKGKTSKEAVENLIGKLASFDAERQTMLEELYQNTYNYIDENAGSLLEGGATSLAQKIDGYRKEIGSPIASLPLAAAQFAVSMFSKSEGRKSLEAVTKTLNTTPVPNVITELFASIRGRSPSNAKIYDMINKVRFTISSIREEFREQYPNIIQEKFSRKLTKAEQSAMHTGIGKTDASSLLGSYSQRQIGRLFSSNSYRQTEIVKLQASMNTAQKDMAHILARYMVTGQAEDMMRRNAYAISRLGDVATEQDIDKYVTILAINYMNNDQRLAVTELFMNEREGMEFALAQMVNFRNAEYAKYGNNPIVRMNQMKGYIPSENEAGKSVKIVEASEHTKMAALGYRRVGSYNGSKADYRGSDLHYYVSSTGSQNTYTQGVAQTVMNSQNGIDIRTGRLVNSTTAAPITGKYVDTVLQRLRQNPNNSHEGKLLPVFDANGNVVALERALSPDMQKMLNKDTNFGKMIGAMGGRQYEEAQAKLFNNELVKAIKEQYDNEADRRDEYVNLASSKDPIHQDTWNNVISTDMKQSLAEVFGTDFFPIRRDMLPMVVGYRNPGVTDAWTGISRLPKATQEGFKTLSTAIFGRKAYEYLYNAEKFWTKAVSEAKSIIVVKSVVVPMYNLLSNVIQLTMKGVPIRAIATNGIKKFVEINAYLENQSKGMRLQAQARATTNDFELAKIKQQIAALTAVNRKMSIWPLIEAGEFNTISEGLTDQDVKLSDGRLGEWVEAQVEKLPKGIQTLGRYAVVSKSTALYKGLNRSVQYGDFIAKAILYDDMVNRRNLDSKFAMGEVTEEFVNYNIPVGRSRTFMESFGLWWFSNYKIGSLKPAIKAIRENPLRAFMGSLTANQFAGLGSPISDNVVATALDGRLANSFGVGMGFRAPSLNPWVNLAGY